jgi:putative ABC transport system substrate-binding protein
MSDMKRRDFITGLTAGAAGWPFVAIAQVPPVPVIGFLSSQYREDKLLSKFQEGLGELGYFEGRNVTIEYRWASNQIERLPVLAAELIQNRAALIATAGGLVTARAARQATSTLPIVFITGLNPVENGFVSSLNRPSGNATGVSQPTREVVPKRVEVLKEMLPNATKIAYLMNDSIAGLGPAERMQQEDQKHIATTLGLVNHFAQSESEIEAAFASVAQQQFDALVVASHPFFLSRRGMIVALAARYALPAVYARREFVEAGGMMSYGPSIPESWRQIGRYAGRILKGARPEDLPIMIQSRFELLINMRTVRALGLTAPRFLRGVADELIQ